MILLNNEFNPKIAIKALSSDKKAQNVAVDYHASCWRLFYKCSCGLSWKLKYWLWNLIEKSDKMQQWIIFQKKSLEDFETKKRRNKWSFELRYKKSWTKCSCGLSYKAPPNPPKAARAGPKASLEGDTKLFKHNVRNLRKGGKFLDVPLSLKDFFPQTTKMIALGFTENTMILDECSTSHQTILLDL